MKEYIYRIACVACGMMVLAACSNNDDVEPTESLSLPVLTGHSVTAQSFSVAWDAVEGARQYGYRLTTSTGVETAAGVTTALELTVDSLKPLTDYTFTLKAFPVVYGTLESDVAVLNVHTPFYEQLVQCPGTYTSYLNNDAGESWSAVLDEDRSGEDYTPDTYGVFTISGFYNRATASLVFTVNDNNTITVLNATGHDDNGWAIVNTGRPQASLKTLYIDEQSSKFDYLNCTLTYKAKLPKSTAPLTETYVWSLPTEED